MKGFIAFIITCAMCTNASFAAVRGTDLNLRTTSDTSQPRTTNSRVATTNVETRTVAPRNISARSTSETRTRTTTNPTRATGRTHGAVISRAATMRPARAATNRETARSAMPISTLTFDTNYQECYDAYFSCMDQFCALQNEKYRRCICSSRLETIQKREHALNETSDSLTDFKNLNIEAILKTPTEVKAMLSASEGELRLSRMRDDSSSMQKLNAISDVLSSTRVNAVSTAGQLDIGGDIKQIWNTTDLISGSNIANLTGEALYNSVHSQCAELIAPRCPSRSTLNLIASAYGMYIENDCSAILSALNKQSTSANTAIRQTNHEMIAARLENYNAHNSSTIDECVAGVRDSLTADTACGENYVHCLDITGLYLKRANGDPIYTKNFYKLGESLSLSGDILTNNKNSKLVAELNAKKDYAKSTLETCRDIADSVWDEFLRQAITEIYQGQQEKIRLVKNECMDVVNVCYDTKTNQLRDYSNISEQFLLGSRLELSEEMCQEQLATCSNLYGGGPNGLKLLITEMQNITNQKIAQNCLGTLRDYAKTLCRSNALDVNVAYPYGCRVYAPGDMLYATNPYCNTSNTPSPSDTEYVQVDENSRLWNILNGQTPPDNSYNCLANRIYTTCHGPKTDAQIASLNISNLTDDEKETLKRGFFFSSNYKKCYKCPDGWTCDGSATLRYNHEDCGDNYIGSLYQKMAQYAIQYCVRPSTYENNPHTEIPNEVLADVNTVMDSIRVDMATVLASECDRMGGEWTTTYSDSDIANKLARFYNETNADFGWGLCKDITQEP